MSISANKRYPRTNDLSTVYLNQIISNPNIVIGDYTFYNDTIHDPQEFERRNILYHYPINGDRLIIGKFCSIACGAKFLFTAGNHAMAPATTYPFPIFWEEWDLPREEVTRAWDNKGDIVIGNDVWIGFEAVIFSGVHIGNGAIIGTRALVTKDVPPYTIVGGVPAKPIRKRFDSQAINALEQMRWWDWPFEHIRRALPLLQAGDIQALTEFYQKQVK